MLKHLIRTVVALAGGFMIAYGAASGPQVPSAAAYLPPDEPECSACDGSNECYTRKGAGAYDCGWTQCRTEERMVCRPGVCDLDGNCEEVCEMMTFEVDCKCTPYGSCG